MRYFFHEKGLEKYFYDLFEEEIFLESTENYSYHINHKKNIAFKSTSNNITDLNYNVVNKKITKLLLNKNMEHYYKRIYTVDLNGMALQFNILVNGAISFKQELKIFNLNFIPEFLKPEYFCFSSPLKNEYYDIEWTGNNYQAQHYLFNFYFMHLNHKIIEKQIIDFEDILNRIPTELDFYENEGFSLKIIDTSIHYPVYNYGFTVENLTTNTIYKPINISNVFECKEDAFMKSIYFVWRKYILTDDYKTENPIIKDLIKEFNLFIKKYKYVP
jgi:hypothetical protein